MQSWYLRENLQNALHGLSQYVSVNPTNDGNPHFFVVTLVQKGNRQTNIEFDIQQLEGGVRATGLLCLLGVGIGLGSIVIYRLYTTLFPYKAVLNGSAVPSKLSHNKFRHSDNVGSRCDDSLAGTPDSGIAADELGGLHNGRDFKRLRRSCSDCGIASRRATGLNQISELFDDDDDEEFTVVSLPVMSGCRRSSAVADWLTKYNVTKSASSCDGQRGHLDAASHGHPSCKSSGFMSSGFGGTGYTSNDLNGSETDQSGYMMSGGVMHRVGKMGYFTRADGASGGSVDLSFVSSLIDAEIRRRRIGTGSERLKVRRFSFSSDAGGSDYTYHESLVSKGYSIDLGEDLAGMLTPPECEDGGRMSGLERWTESSMEKLHDELKKIQCDIDDMNHRIGGLQSRDTIFYAIVPSEDFSPCESSPRDHPGDLIRFSPLNFSMDNLGESSSLVKLCRERSSSPVSMCDSTSGSAEHGLAADFMWDYQSDLALELSASPSFVARRPFIAEKSCELDTVSRHLDFEDVCEAGEMNGCTGADLYIDDDLITLEVNGLSGDDMKVRVTLDGDALVPGGDLMDWFDGEESWSAMPPCDKPEKKQITEREKEKRERRVRKSSESSLNDVFIMKKGSRSRGSSGTSSGSRPVQPVKRKLPSNEAFIKQSASRPCSGRSLLDGCQSTPPLGSRPPTGVSTPVATVKPLTEPVSVSSGSCCRGSLVSYNLAMEGLARASMGWVVENIGSRVEVREWVERMEVQASVKQGYCQILGVWKQTCIRPIRADMYCIVRAVLYQAMIKQMPILSGAKTLDFCYQQLSKCMSSAHRYMSEWSFANRLPFARESVQMKLAECLHALFEQVSLVSGMSGEACREDYLISLFNRNPDTDLRLLEGVKVLMMLKAVALYEDFTSGRAVAPYVWHLFTRDSCRTVEQLFFRFINPVGDTTRLGEAELSLLGHTLGVQVQVARPHCEEVFVMYPDEGAERYDVIQLIEDVVNGGYCVLSS